MRFVFNCASETQQLLFLLNFQARGSLLFFRSFVIDPRRSHLLSCFARLARTLNIYQKCLKTFFPVVVGDVNEARSLSHDITTSAELISNISSAQQLNKID